MNQINKGSSSALNIRDKPTFPSYEVSKDSVESLLSFKGDKWKQAEAIRAQRKYINLTLGTEVMNSRQESSLMREGGGGNHVVSLFGGSVDRDVGRGKYSLDAAFSGRNQKPDEFDVAQSKLYAAMKYEQFKQKQQENAPDQASEDTEQYYKLQEAYQKAF